MLGTLTMAHRYTRGIAVVAQAVVSRLSDLSKACDEVAPGPESHPFGELSVRQQQIADRLGEQSQVLAGWFVGGCVLVRERRPPNWPELAAHTGRDLMDRSFQYFDVPRAKATQWATLVGNLVAAVGDDLATAPSVEIKGKGLRHLRKLAQAVESSKSRVTLTDLATAAGRPLPPMQAAGSALDALWTDTRMELVKAAHLREGDVERADPQRVLAAWDRMEELLAAQLRATPFWQLDGELQELADTEQPTVEHVRRALALARGNAVLSFFESLSSPAWLQPMSEAGLFDEPEPADVTAEGHYRLPAWPPSRYLVRVARAAPREVVRVIADLPPTDNGRIHEDLVDALLAMPVDHAKELLPRVCGWLGGPYQLGAGIRLAQFVARLASEGEVDSAFELASTLFAVDAEAAPHRARLGPEWVLRHNFGSLYGYDEGLMEVAEPLREADAARTVRFLANLLDGMLATLRRAAGDSGPEDDSWSWRKAVEDHEQNNQSEDPRDAVLVALRDSCESLINDRPDSALVVLRELESREHLLFRRLRLHLLRVCDFPAADELRGEELSRRETLDDITTHHEVFMLLGERFGQLKPDDRDLILRAITAGPDTDSWSNAYESKHGKPPPPDELKEYEDHWVGRRLWMVRHHLTDPEAQQLSRFVSSYGEPEHPEFLMWHQAGFYAVDVAMSQAELQELSVPELLELFRTWTPSPDALGFVRPDNLAAALHDAVREDVAYWSAIAGQLTGAPLLYKRYLLAGLRDSPSTELDWASVLSLAESVVFDDATEPSSDSDATLEIVAGFLRRALRQGAPPGGSYPAVVRLIDALLQHRPALGESDASWHPGLSLTPPHTVRADAVDAATSLAWWALRDGSGRSSDGASLDAVPDIKAVLDRCVGEDCEAAPAVRAALAARLGLLQQLDEPWAESAARVLFGSDDERLRDAAWSGYLFDGPLRRDMLRLLLRLGLFADVTAWLPRRQDVAEEYRRRLGMHLVLGAVWQLDDIDAVWSAWGETADARDRAAAVEWMGHTAHEQSNEEKEELAAGLAGVWRARLALTTDADELAAYGTWFVAEVLEPEEAAGLLEATAALSNGRLVGLRRVLAVATHVAARAPGPVLQTVEYLLAGPQAHELAWSEGRVREVLRAAWSTGDGDVRAQAERLVDAFGERGLDMRDATATD